MMSQQTTLFSLGRLFLSRIFRFGVVIPFLTVPLKFWGVLFESDSKRGLFLRRSCLVIFSSALLIASSYQILMLGFFPPKLERWVVDFLNFILFIPDDLYFAFWELNGWRGILYKYFIFLVFTWTVFSPVHAAVAFLAGRGKGRSRFD